MTDDAQQAAATTDAHASQIIESEATDVNAQGRGVHLPEGEKPEEKLSTRDAIAKAFEDTEKGAKEPEAKEDEKPKDKAEAEKPETKDGKADKPEKDAKEAEKPAKGEDDAKADKGAAEKPAAERSAPEDGRQSEGRKYAEPPARFLPEARTKWANVPNEVKAEFHRVSQEVETELETYRESHEAYESIREFADRAKYHGTDLKTALTNYVGIENMLRQSPEKALAAILGNIGLTPRQYAEHVMKNPQAHVAPQGQQQRQQGQPQQSAEMTSLTRKVTELESQLKTAPLIPVVERFAAEHTDYRTLEPKIGQILKSGVIDNLYGTGLSPEQKLAEAYRIAGGSSPSHSKPEPVPDHSDAAPAPPANDPDGQKSITGSPSSGQTGKTTWKPKSNREALERAIAEAR